MIYSITWIKTNNTENLCMHNIVGDCNKIVVPRATELLYQCTVVIGKIHLIIWTLLKILFKQTAGIPAIPVFLCSGQLASYCCYNLASVKNLLLYHMLSDSILVYSQALKLQHEYFMDVVHNHGFEE